MSPPDGLQVDRHNAITTDGWVLDLKRTVAPERLRPRTRPVMIIPGYGMNSFIFGFHPGGTSMERSLAEAGFEVWSGNLRATGDAKPRTGDHIGPPPGPSMRAYARFDLPALVDTVLGASRTHARRLDIIGCSLGGSVAYAYLALLPDAPVQALVNVGTPLRLTRLHPVLRAAFTSPWVAERLAFRGARPLLRAGAGLLQRAPLLLAPYMNTAHVDLTDVHQMLETVEDPYPLVNRDIALWLQKGDLVIDGINITDAMRAQQRPLLLVVANRDGIVSEMDVLSVTSVWGGSDLQVMRVGDEQDWYAHADLFVGDDAPRVVFAPVAEWLHARGGGTFKDR